MDDRLGCAIVIVWVLVLAIIALWTGLANAQDVCAPKPRLVPAPHLILMSMPSTSSAPSPVIERSESPAPAPARRRAASTVRHPFPSERPDVLLWIAALVGVAIGRQSARRAALSIDAVVIDAESVDTPARPVRRLGAASVTGPVRESNQDRVAVARIAGLDTMLIADGLGGLPRGGDAAELVVRYALARLEAELPAVIAARENGVRALLLNIIWGAGVELACLAARENWKHEEMGLRTTLILVVASADLYVSAWIGDGGLFLLREDKTIVELVDPHKDMATPDLLQASLGPWTEGRPSWSLATRMSGDTLVGATDGIADVFDRTDGSLTETVRDALRLCEGDAEDASHKIVDLFARLRDHDGNPPLTDNLTLALLTTESAS